MAQATTVAGLQGVMKDAWTGTRVLKQFYNQYPLLKMIPDAVGATVIGLQAQVPLQTGQPTGYTSVAPAGGALNPAVATPVAQATYTMVYHYLQVGLEMAVLNQTNTSVQAIIAGKDLEMKGAVDGLSKQASRQLARNGDSILAECATSGGASTTLPLRPPSDGINGHGQPAIVRGHIQPGMLVDVGTTADTDALATGATITAVNKSATAPTITLSAAVDATSGTHFVYVANPNSATAPNPELNGIENIIGSGTFGGINPATAGNEYWQAAVIDSTTTTFSLPMALAIGEAVFQNTGTYDAKVFTSAHQMANMYLELQNQVRFPSEKAMGAGGVGGLVGLDWNGTGVNVIPDIYPNVWAHLRLEDLCVIKGSIDKPTWVSDIEGAGGDVRWVQGTTGFGNAICWPWQLGATSRRGMGIANNLKT
jgi:hypothetical protein